MKIKVVQTDKGCVAISDLQVPLRPGGTVGNFLCLDELEHGFDKALVNSVGDCSGCRKIIATDESIKLDGVPQFRLEQKSESHQGLYSKNDLRDAIRYLRTHNKMGKSVDMLTDEIALYLNKPKRLVGIEVEVELTPVNHASGLPLTGHPLMDISIKENYTVKVEDDFLIVREYFYERD